VGYDQSLYQLWLSFGKLLKLNATATVLLQFFNLNIQSWFLPQLVVVSGIINPNLIIFLIYFPYENGLGTV
jgi:hypothetical protein